MGKGVLVNGEEVDDEEAGASCSVVRMLPLITDAASPRTGLESRRGQDREGHERPDLWSRPQTLAGCH